jgi:hypothetical protein
MNAPQTAQEIKTLRPLPVSTENSDNGLDEAYEEGFNLTHLMRLVGDQDEEGDWRERADVAHAYVDGKQFTDEQQAALIEEGMKDVKPTNLVGRVVRSICGQEARTRTDPRVDADEDALQDLCDVFNPRLAEAKRETYADLAISNAYNSQVVGGIGWVEVARNSDCLAYPYRVKDIHRAKMYWDRKAEDMLLRDARWITRMQWQDLDEVQAALPGFKELLENVSSGWSNFAFDNYVDDSLATNILLGRYFRAESRWNQFRRRSEWYDQARRRVRMYEVWYKVPAQAIYLTFSPTHRVLFDPDNQAHIAAVNAGRAQVAKGLTYQIRMSLFAGPHRLQDLATTRRNYPFVPFIAYRDDEDGSPYGMVEGMIAPQDEYNARRIRINWLLRSKQVVLDEDALAEKANSLEEVVNQVNRPDMTVVLNPNRVNRSENAFRVESNLMLQKEQIEVMQDAKQNIQDTAGVYGSQLGQAASGVTSGIANSLLIEQGTVAMGDLNDNYRHARRLVFENLLDLICEDHQQVDMPVKVGMGETARVVLLNHWNPEKGEIENDVKDAPLRVGLSDVPSTPAFKLQQQTQIASIITALGKVAPAAAAVMAPSFIEATDLPDRTERADDVRRALNIPTAGDRKAAEQQRQQQAQEQAEQKALQQKAILLEMAGKEAEVEKTQSETGLNQAKTVEIGHNMGLATRQQDMSERPEAPQDPEQESPEDADARMIDEAIAEARQLRQAGAPMQ